MKDINAVCEKMTRNGNFMAKIIVESDFLRTRLYSEKKNVPDTNVLVLIGQVLTSIEIKRLNLTLYFSIEPLCTTSWGQITERPVHFFTKLSLPSNLLKRYTVTFHGLKVLHVKFTNTFSGLKIFYRQSSAYRVL